MAYKEPNLPENIEKARASRRKHYANNKQAYKDRARARTRELIQITRDIRDITACTDCGVQYRFWVMQFDHLEGLDKVGDVSALSRQGNKQKLLDEIAKCEVVCANCHAERTWRRLGVDEI